MNANSSAGIDIHRTTLPIAVRKSTGELTGVRPFPACVDKIDHFFSHLPSHVYRVIEAAGLYERLLDHLEPGAGKSHAKNRICNRCQPFLHDPALILMD